MNILDKRFKYTSSDDTDIKKTFARIRRELAKQQKSAVNVTPIKKRATK